MKRPIFIFAGETSGDMYGAALLRSLKKHFGYLRFTGVGGPEMRSQGIECIQRIEDFGVMGFSDTLWALPRLWKQFNQLRDYILETAPRAAIFIDSPSLSLRMARDLRKRGYKGKIVQYICPAVWAWGRKRVSLMAEVLDLLLTIYPFESSYFAHTPLSVQFVGHPLREMLLHHSYDPNWHRLFGVKHTENLVGIFPGSRSAEIKRNLPKQLEAAEMLRKQNPEVSFAVSCAHDNDIEIVEQMLDKTHLQVHRDVFVIPKPYSYDLMKSCHCAIAKSGTVTLELALHKCPTVVVYELTLLNKFIAKYLLRVNLPHYCIVNILAGKKIFPELIDAGFSSQELYQELRLLHEVGATRNRCLDDCGVIRKLLQEEDTSKRAAQAIHDELVR